MPDGTGNSIGIGVFQQRREPQWGKGEKRRFVERLDEIARGYADAANARGDLTGALFVERDLAKGKARMAELDVLIAAQGGWHAKPWTGRPCTARYRPRTRPNGERKRELLEDHAQAMREANAEAQERRERLIKAWDTRRAIKLAKAA